MSEKPRRRCGPCSECCTLIPVGELDKPGFTRCEHLRKRRCSIYAERPPGCRLFECAWLMQKDGPQGKPVMPALLRPDKVGAVMWGNVMLSTDGASQEIMQISTRTPELHPRMLEWMLPLTYYFPIQVVHRNVVTFWQDGKRLVTWHNKNEFIETTWIGRKIDQVIVRQASEILATDADRERWEAIERQRIEEDMRISAAAVESENPSP